jgi:hypothetical protein
MSNGFLTASQPPTVNRWLNDAPDAGVPLASPSPDESSDLSEEGGASSARPSSDTSAADDDTSLADAFGHGAMVTGAGLTGMVVGGVGCASFPPLAPFALHCAAGVGGAFSAAGEASAQIWIDGQESVDWARTAWAGVSGAAMIEIGAAAQAATAGVSVIEQFAARALVNGGGSNAFGAAGVYLETGDAAQAWDALTNVKTAAIAAGTGEVIHFGAKNAGALVKVRDTITPADSGDGWQTQADRPSATHWPAPSSRSGASGGRPYSPPEHRTTRYRYDHDDTSGRVVIERHYWENNNDNHSGRHGATGAWEPPSSGDEHGQPIRPADEPSWVPSERETQGRSEPIEYAREPEAELVCEPESADTHESNYSAPDPEPSYSEPESFCSEPDTSSDTDYSSSDD